MPAIMKEVNLHQHHYHDHRWWRLKFQRERERVKHGQKNFPFSMAHKTPEQKYIIKISTLSLHSINRCFSFINLF